MTTLQKGVLLAVTLLLGACGGEPEEEVGAGADTTAAQDTTVIPGMPGMQGVPGMQMMQQMETHMREMEGLSPDSLRAMMPAHRQMAANALAEMERQMRGMNMMPDAQWNATADSLRQDLTRMPEMSAQELEAVMPAHNARIRRLMDMHRAMMPSQP